MTEEVQNKEEKLLKESEASALLDVHHKTLYAWRKRGNVDLPYFKIGGKIRYRKSDIDAFKAGCLRGGKK